jgi:hypothetical protein
MGAAGSTSVATLAAAGLGVRGVSLTATVCIVVGDDGGTMMIGSCLGSSGITSAGRVAGNVGCLGAALDWIYVLTAWYC